MPKAAPYSVRISDHAHRVSARLFAHFLAAGLIVAESRRVGAVAAGVRAQWIGNQLSLYRPLGVSIPSNWRAVERAFLIANAGQHQMPLGFSERLIREKYASDPERAQAEIAFLRQHQREWDIRVFHTDN